MQSMKQPPTPDELREIIAPLDDLDRKVLGGIVARWMAEPTTVAALRPERSSGAVSSAVSKRASRSDRCSRRWASDDAGAIVGR